MKYELAEFQKNAVHDLLRKMQAMQHSYETDGSLSAVSLTAPTGAGKTVIAAAVAEGLFAGNETFPGDDRAVILWLSDSPSLNQQTLKRFEAASDQLPTAATMQVIDPEFARRERKLSPGHIYFLNRQLLSARGKLTNETEGSRTFYDLLTDTLEDPEIHLFLFIDEAHRGLGKDATPETVDKTIYAKLIDGQKGKNPPMPAVVGISATPERFQAAMQGRQNRDIKAPVEVPVSQVRDSGLIKDTIELRTPKKAADTKHQDLTLACIKLAQVSKTWKEYCGEHQISPPVFPLLIVQVEDKVSLDTLSSLCAQIRQTLPWLDVSTCFANVFGEHEDLVTPAGKIPYCPPEEVGEHTEIRVLFAKDAVSTGWDCPRAEVIYSRRKRSDPTYITQLIGRMIRTPLGRRVKTVEELNTVSCYLPEYDAQTVELVVNRLKEDNIPVAAANILKNPADVRWFGETQRRIERLLQNRQRPAADGGTLHASQQLSQEGPQEEQAPDFSVHLPEEEWQLAYAEEGLETEDQLRETLARIPRADSEALKASFEGIVTRQVRHDKPNAFLDLWDCVDIIQEDLDSTSGLGETLQEEFYNNVEGEIRRHPAEFKRAFSEIRNTTVSVKRVDPLTGEEFEDREELVENDTQRMTAYYKRAVHVFAGASDLIKYYINKRKDEQWEGDPEAISRICAVAACMEIVQAMEEWAEAKTRALLDRYGPQRYGVSEENLDRWNRVEGNTLPYIERTLHIQASVTRQNKDYDPYPKHIISDGDGWAYLNLNELEKKVVETELSRPMNVAWYRNQSRNLNASLSIPYYLNGEWENMYPDFLFFQQTGNGSIVRTIVDPHGDWLGDSVAKLKGYVAYLRDHPDLFGSVLAVAEDRDKTCRYLDLTLPSVQNAIDIFTGSSAKELFHGPLSQVYAVRQDR